MTMQAKTISLPILALFLHLQSQAQTWSWAQSIGSPNNPTTIKTIRPYTGGNLLVCGAFAAPTLQLGNITLQNAGQDDGYVAITNASGQYLWAEKFGGAGRDFVVDVAVGPNGDFAILGNFNSVSITVGGINLFNSGETDAFLAYYNADKTLSWVRKIGTSNIEEAVALSVDASGNVFLAGQVFDKFTLSNLHVFLRKTNSAGTMLWEQKGITAGFGTLRAASLTLDQNQNAYLGGTLSGMATFGTINLNSEWGESGFIVKYNTDGALLDTLLRQEVAQFNGLQTHENNLYACAEKINYGIGWGWPLADSKIHVLKFNQNLDLQWHKTSGGESTSQSQDIAKSISVDDAGNAYITGYFFSDTLHFAGQNLPNYFNINYFYPQIFVLKYSSAGQELWGKSLGGLHADEATCILATSDDKFILGGNFESNPVPFDNFQLQNTGQLDSMYVHLRPGRYVRKSMGFLAMFDKDLSSYKPEPTAGALSIFPNPTSGQLVLQLQTPETAPIRLQINAPDGRLAHQSEHAAAPNIEIHENLSHLAPGLYFITLQTANALYSGKFIKE